MYGTAHYNAAQYNTGGGLFVELALSETSTISDVLAKRATLGAFAESLTATDSITKTVSLVLQLAETFGISDVIIKGVEMALSQELNMGDGASTLNQHTLTEDITPADDILNQAIKTCIEFQFMFDTIEFRREKTLGETVFMNDWLTVGKDSNPWH